ncbi:MAG TPA: hypothetical protein VK447_17910 [Myxococcaceae bacterium]|nr:hypothetical protein [Myxococcaceae bacterium]
MGTNLDGRRSAERVGLLLAVALAQPESARFPFFADEGWPEGGTH